MNKKRGCSRWLKVFPRNRLSMFAGCALFAGCAGTPNPVLYPNNHLQQVGQAAADRDIAECRQLAGSSGVAETKDGKVAGQAAGGAAVGGAAAGTVRGAMNSGETSPVYKNFVQKCLRDRGYEVIGWQ